MPAKSQKQFRFMKAVENGNIKAPGLSQAKAKEFTEGQKYSNLPKNIKTPGFTKIRKYLKGE